MTYFSKCIVLATLFSAGGKDQSAVVFGFAPTQRTASMRLARYYHRATYFQEPIDFHEVGDPRPELAPEEIPPLLMTALSNNDFPTKDSGLKSVWAFSGDTCKFIFRNNCTDFIESAHVTARDFPTSFYGNAFFGKKWEMETEINRVGGEDGWIATQVMNTISSDGRLRRWQWELRKHRRPPLLNCWYVETIGSSDRKGHFEPE